MGKYYSEEIIKDTPWRQDYADSINGFMESQLDAAQADRDAFMSPEKYLADPEKYRRGFAEMLGFPLNLPVETPLCAKKEFVAEDGNVNIYRMQLAFACGIKFYGLYFEQKENPAAHPFLLSIHGGGGTPEVASSIHNDSANYNHLTRRATDRGANVFAPQLLLWADGTYGNVKDRNVVNGRLRQLGGSISALEVWLMKGSISYFIEHENADADRVGVIGLSYGGMYTLFMAALDTRVKAAMSCSWFNEDYIMCREDWAYKNSLHTYNQAEFAALACPRALYINMGDADQMFGYKTTQAQFARLMPYYEAAGVPENCKLKIFSGLHELDKEDDGYDFLFEKLG